MWLFLSDPSCYLLDQKGQIPVLTEAPVMEAPNLIRFTVSIGDRQYAMRFVTAQGLDTTRFRGARQEVGVLTAPHPDIAGALIQEGQGFLAKVGTHLVTLGASAIGRALSRRLERGFRRSKKA